MHSITTFTATAVDLPNENVDTDQIIPARFLKTTQRTGLGVHLFADWRYDADGAPRADFVLNRTESRGAQILVAGHNFGCGSSREHAPWALADLDRKSTRLNSSHPSISYAVFCLKKKKNKQGKTCKY